MKFVAYDLETTGIISNYHEIIEIAAIRLSSSLEIEETLEVKIKPRNIERASTKALELNGYYIRDWSQTREMRDVLIDLNKMAIGCSLIGHNPSFDWAFLDHAYHAEGISWSMDHRRFDIMSMALFHLYPEKVFFGFDHLCKYYNVVNEAPHTAMGDASAVVGCLKAMFTAPIKREIRSLQNFFNQL